MIERFMKEVEMRVSCSNSTWDARFTVTKLFWRTYCQIPQVVVLGREVRLVTIGIRCHFRFSSFMVKERSPISTSCFLAFIALHYHFHRPNIELICWLVNNDWRGVWAKGLHILMTYLQIWALVRCRCRLLKPTLLSTRYKIIGMDLYVSLLVWLKDFAGKPSIHP